MLKNVSRLLLFSVAVLLFSACQSAEEVVETMELTSTVASTPVETVSVAPTVAVAPTAVTREEIDEPAPVRKELVICQSREPESLYFYSAADPAATAVFHALYENDITTLSYGVQAQGIEKIPALADGDAYIRRVEVQTGDIVVDLFQEVAILEEGVTVLNADGQEVVFDGTSVIMDQLVVNFTMKQRFWADGVPVTAEDSVYSYELNADPVTPADKSVVLHTASYTASGPLSTQWVGLPGFRDNRYFLNFWQPMPRHLWDGLTAAELLEADVSSRLPVGDGPFMIVEWLPDDSIRLARNPHYYRRDEGLPYLDSVVYKFVPEPNEVVAQLLSGACDIGTHDGLDINLAPFLIEAAGSGFLTPYFQTGTVYEHIDFGINSYGSYGDGNGRPDWFEDVRVRQAMTMCTDRQGMVDTILYGRSQIMHSYLPEIHPLYSAETITQWPYDPDAANELLDEAGYLDNTGDGLREDPQTGQPFSVTFSTTGSELRRQTAVFFRENMRECGIEVVLDYRPANELFAHGVESPVFGRRFDLSQFGWPIGHTPRCHLYTSWQITGPEEEINPATGEPYIGWQRGLNNTGWWDPEYDAACRQAAEALPGTAPYVTNHHLAQQIFADNLPVIPLFLRLEVAAARPEVLNFEINPTQRSELWNLYQIDIQSDAAASE